MNRILKAIEEGKESVDFYLSDTPTDEFISDIKDIVKTYSDKQAIRKAVIGLNKILDGK